MMRLYPGILSTSCMRAHPWLHNGWLVCDQPTMIPKYTKMMTGDVNSAFRHIPIHADSVGRFAGTVPELGILVIDLCCPFGWTDSPGYYWVGGAAI